MQKNQIFNFKELIILVVEDDLLTSHAITVALQRKGFVNILSAKNGDEVSNHISNNDVSLILMDIYLENNDSGIDIAEEISKLRQIPIIFMTNDGDEETFYKALKLSPTNIIIKPLDFRQLVNSTICTLNLRDH